MINYTYIPTHNNKNNKPKPVNKAATNEMVSSFFKFLVYFVPVTS